MFTCCFRYNKTHRDLTMSSSSSYVSEQKKYNFFFIWYIFDLFPQSVFFTFIVSVHCDSAYNAQLQITQPAYVVRHCPLVEQIKQALYITDWNCQCHSSSSPYHEICLPVHENVPIFAYRSSPILNCATTLFHPNVVPAEQKFSYIHTPWAGGNHEVQ